MGLSAFLEVELALTLAVEAGNVTEHSQRIGQAETVTKTGIFTASH